MKNWKFHLKHVTALSLLSLLLCSCSSTGPKTTCQKHWAFIPPVAATYGDHTITKQQFLDEIDYLMPGGVADLPREDYKPLAKKIINDMIDEHILLKYAAEDGIKPQSQLVKQEFQQFLKALSKQERQAFTQSLKARNTTLADYESKLCSNEEAQVGLAIHKWTAFEFKHIKVSDDEIQAYYQNSKAKFKPRHIGISHILIKPKDDSPESIKAAKQQADKIYQKLLTAPGDFTKLAKANSHCSSGPENDGYVGPFAPGDMKDKYKHLEPTIFKMKHNEISKPLQSPDGFHIVKVEHPEPEKLDNIKEFIADAIRTQKQKEHVDALLKKERSKTKVTFNF